MKDNILLTISSLLTIVLTIFHITSDHPSGSMVHPSGFLFFRDWTISFKSSAVSRVS